MKQLQLFLFSILLVPALATAHGPSRQKVVEEIEINASPDKVWGIVSDFCSIKDWNPQITNCEADKGTEKGSVRTIELDNGEKISEKLHKYSAGDKKMLYFMEKLEEGRIIKGLPVSTLSSTITVSENNGKATVQMKAAFYRSFPGAEPPPELSDEACIAAVTKLFQSGLNGIKELAEK